MRCFESFFKRTWRPQQVHQMDAASRFESTTKRTAEVHHHATGEAMTELNEVNAAPSSSITTSMPHTSGDPAPCKNGCKIWRTNDVGESRSESPWHLLKTVFLVCVIVMFILWIIIYTLLDQYRIL